jgi:ubiquinone/menaquinone biosynthesis C-methylase UbiE
MPRREAARGPNRWFFDAWSRIYDLPPVQWATYRPVHNAVLHTLRATPCHRLLDIGCGTGQLASRLAAALPRTRVVGCDFSAGMLERAAARNDGVSWVRGDAGRLPFGEGAFDAITSTEAFHWFPDQDAALAEFFRVLRPGGRLLLALVNTLVPLISDAFYVGSRLVGEPFYWPTTRQMRDRVEGAGFEVHRQQRIYRVSGFLLPPVLTEAVRPERRHPRRDGTRSR